MGRWVRLCSVSEVPAEGTVSEQRVEELEICLAALDGKLKALANQCPHRQGPLGQGWIEGNSVVCPWHSWVFDVDSGEASYPPGEHVRVYPIRVDGDDVMLETD